MTPEIAEQGLVGPVSDLGGARKEWAWERKLRKMVSSSKDCFSHPKGIPKRIPKRIYIIKSNTKNNTQSAFN